MHMDRGRSEENLMQQQQQPPRGRPPEGQVAADDHHQPPPHQRCPRCDSYNTKFCYYNNYSLSQPRYFCKACRRYWTQGGTLRNVPIGGGCRKGKRPRTSSSSISNSLVARTQGLSPAVRHQNLTGMISSQSSRPIMAPVTPTPPMGGPFYPGGSFLSSLATMHTLPAAGINQGAAVGGGATQFGANMALLQGLSLPPLKPPAPPHQFPPPMAPFFPPQPSLIPPGPVSSWAQSIMNSGGGASSSSAAPAGFWSSAAAGGSDQAGSSSTPNPWSDSNPGFNPSQ